MKHNKKRVCANKHALGDMLNKIGGGIGNLDSGGMGVLNGIAGAGSGILGSLINPSGVSTGAGTALQGIGSLASNIPGIGGLVGAGVGLLGGIGNAMFGSKMNDTFINQTENAVKQQENFNSNATTTNQLLSDWGALTNLANVRKSQVGKDGWFSNKAQNKTRELNENIQEANERALLNLSNTARNVEQIGDANILSNFMAKGGKIHIKPSKRDTFKAQTTKMGMGVQEAVSHKDKYSPAMRKKATFAKNASKWHANGGEIEWTSEDIGNPVYSKKITKPIVEQEKLFIKNPQESSIKRFNKLANVGFGVARLFPTTGLVMNVIDAIEAINNKDEASYASNVGGGTSKMIYKAGKIPLRDVTPGRIHSRNLGKSILGKAGILLGAQDAVADINDLYKTITTPSSKYAKGGFMDYDTGITLIDEGGTHEGNPNEGVQVGVDPQGVPNLVEEGEVIYKDYVFSNRIKVPKEVKKKYKFRGETFSDVARNIQKETKEKPNDPLTKNSIEAAMSRLAFSQESKRENTKNKEGGKNEYAQGGYSMGLEERDLNDSDMDWVTSLFNTSKAPTGTLPPTGTSVPKDTKRPTWGRYMPILGSLAATITDAVEKPDYSSVDAIVEASIPRRSVAFSPVGTKISFDPFDRGYYVNQLNANNAATRRAITENSGGNRAAALAGLLASDFNYSRQLGDVGRKADEYNNAMRERAASFNRQTDMFNSEGAMKATMANKSDDEMRFRAGTTAAQMREAIKDRGIQRRSTNISSFLQQLGDLGSESEQRNWLDNLAKRGVLRMDTTGRTYSKGGKRR